MSRLLAIITVVFASFPACAEDRSKPAALTPQEIAAGEIMLFDNETTYGWTIEGEASVKDGHLILGGTKATTATCTSAFLTKSVKWELDDGANLPDSKKARVTMTAKFANQTGTPGKVMAFTTEGELTQIAIAVPAGTTARVSRVSVTPATKTSLFNGKNLEGWSVNKADPKRMASKWDVTKEGELSLKNGPGDLVSDKAFDNFILQLDCKTLGKALNSGVFLRCIPGQYQNGYEAQIQNAYKDDDRTKPIDFGTGAIYRRIPARKVVSNDNEWFTMTVLADGKHFATWVNGYQTVDWTDNRPANDNPRNGYRAAKGPISLQGHDPTTDLLFRNIRIAELDVAEKK